MPSPSLVVVMANGDHVNYKFTDKDHMFFETPWGNCYYQRAD
ncbi:MAG TPA: hypothetical protein VMT38_07310 [Terracidiphilus sp.]|nr:hypothetical protein [Terracidiphilus sp.]